MLPRNPTSLSTMRMMMMTKTMTGMAMWSGMRTRSRQLSMTMSLMRVPPTSISSTRRLPSSAHLLMMTTTIWMRRASWKLLSTRSNPTACSSTSCSVCLPHSPFFFHLLTTASGLQQEQPQLYESLTKVLGPDEQQVIQGVFHEADAKAMVAAANAEAAAAAGMQANGN